MTDQQGNIFFVLPKLAFFNFNMLLGKDPTLIVYRKSREVKRTVGLQSVKTLTALLQASPSNGNLESPPSLNPEH